MMRKYFPLEASERLFVAIEEDDVVDAQVSLPPTIALSCTTEIIHDNYALCLQFWLNGVDRQELLRLVRKQAKGDELTAVFKEASGRIFIRQNDRFSGAFSGRLS